MLQLLVTCSGRVTIFVTSSEHITIVGDF